MPEILPGVHQVEGVDPSPDFSTHVYLVRDGPDRWSLIDTGLPGSDRAIVAYLKKVGIAPSSIQNILLTHLHRDHTGNLRRMAELTKARTFAHWLEAAFIAVDPPYDGPGTPPAEPFSVDERLKDGDTVDAAGGLQVLHTPGHTPGHVAYYQAERKLLFSGDLFFGQGANGVVLTVQEYTHHMPSALVSARRVAELPIESLLTYHGGPLLRNGGRAIQTMLRTR